MSLVKTIRTAPLFNLMTAVHLRAAALFLFVAWASPMPALERVLLPVVFGGTGAPGAHGSLWRTFLTGYNANDHYVRVVESLLPCSTLCPTPPAAGRAAFEYDPYTPPGLGRYLYIGNATTPSGEADAVHLSFRAQDMSRQAETWGTELPVVREREYRDSITLLDVPTSDEFRVTLRIFVPDVERTTVRVVVFRGAVRIYEADLPVQQPVPGYEEYPAQLAINDLARTIPQLSGSIPVRILVSGDQPLWAFASATNSTTQHVTTSTPR